MEPYQPISCSFYDELEARATMRVACVVVFQRPGAPAETVKGLIRDFRIREGAEFMIMEDGAEIRLDWLVAVDGMALPDSC